METNLRNCKVCHLPKVRTESGKYNEKDKKYVDETGAAWNGSCCPPCHREVVRIKIREKRRGIV